MSNCTAEEWYQSLNNANGTYGLSCLTPGQSIGIALTAESGFISLVSVLVVFGLILRKLFRNVKLIQRPTDVYMLSLFACDLVQALGGVLDVKWANEGKVYTGTYCTAQGVIQQLGETGVALATLTIAVHTFIVVLWGKLKKNTRVAYIVVACNWTFVILFVSITVSLKTKGSTYYETPTPYWCWIGDGKRNDKFRIAGEYFWLWFTLFVSILLYIPLGLWAQGNLTVDPDVWWRIRIHRNNDTRVADRSRKRRAIGMIAYPLVYSIAVLPLSAIRWATDFGASEGTHRPLPSVATFIVIFLYSLSGAFNVLLFFFTRRDLLLLGNTSGQGHAPGAVKVPPDIKLTITHTTSRHSYLGSDAGSAMSTPTFDQQTPREPATAVGILPLSTGGPQGGQWEFPQHGHGV